MSKTVVVIPVRKGSQRVKNKNIRRFANSNLLQIKIDVIKTLDWVDDIIVNTDCNTAIAIAKENGLKYHRREDFYASSECNNSDYHHYLARVTEAENILVAQVTAPLISKKTYDTAMKKYLESGCNSLMSVKAIKEFIWFEGCPVNYDLYNAPNSQDLPNYFHPTFGIIICQRSALLKSKNFICSNPEFLTISDRESVDVDTLLDFEFAEYLYSQNIPDSTTDYFDLVREDEKNQIGIDFDGVIHKCSKGFFDGTIYDEPVDGTIDALCSLSKNYNIVAYTCKAKSDRPLVNGKTGTELVWEWLRKYNLDKYISEVTAEKPRAKYYIDDKAIVFTNWESVLEKITSGGDK